MLRNLWEIDTTAHQSRVSWKKKPKNEAVAQKSMYIRVLLSDGEGMKQLHDGGGRAPPYTHTAQGDRQAASARGKKQRMHRRPCVKEPGCVRRTFQGGLRDASALAKEQKRHKQENKDPRRDAVSTRAGFAGGGEGVPPAAGWLGRHHDRPGLGKPQHGKKRARGNGSKKLGSLSAFMT